MMSKTISARIQKRRGTENEKKEDVYKRQLSFCNDEDVLKMAGNDNVSTAMSGREACLSIYRMDGKVPVMAWGKIYKTNLFKDIRYPVGMVHEDDATTDVYKRQVDACALLVRRGVTGFHWWIVGGGPEEAALRERAERLGVRDTVTLLGMRENPYPYIRQADRCV